MAEVILFFVSLAVVTWGLRFAAQVYYRTNVVAIRPASDDASAPSEEDDEALVAVLAAAASVALERKVVLKKFRFLHTTGSSAWAVTGKLNVMGSHLITKRNQST